MATSHRLTKAEKDVRKLANARSVGVSPTMPHSGSEFEPTNVMLQRIVQERNSAMKCSHWSREKLLEWLSLNPTSEKSDMNDIIRDSCSVLPIAIPAVASPPPLKRVNQAGVTPTSRIFRWNKHLEARLIAVICSDTIAFSKRDESCSWSN